MTDKELAIAVLEAMGYERDETCPWEVWRNDEGNYWEPSLNSPDGHAFAAEVKEFMRKKGFYRREWQDLSRGNIVFYQRPFIISGQGWYGDQECYPRAVCEAAIAALKGEPCS